MTSNSPIGVFDSGLGGLTVLKELMKAMPYEDFVYLGDTARIPYGVKSSQTVKKYAQQNVDFLSGQGVKAIVIACNSASTVAEGLKSEIPVLGVIQPGAMTAAATTQNKKVGVIATRTTVSQRSYIHEIQNLDKDIQVFQQACPLLVPLVEEGWDNDPITNLVVYRYLSPLLASEIDTLVLGCTHYPILMTAIQKVTGRNVNIVTSGASVARKLLDLLEEKGLKNSERQQDPEFRLLTTDDSDTYKSLANRLMSDMAYTGVELVDIQ